MVNFTRRAVRKAWRIGLRGTAWVRPTTDVAIIGYGDIAPDHAAAYEGLARARLAAVADPDLAALAKARARDPLLRVYRDYRRLLAEVRPGIVSVCTWPQLHAGIVEAAAEFGARGILCEKPLALRMDEVDRMVAVCQQRGVRLGCGLQWRFHPALRAAADLVRRGELGRPSHVEGAIRGSLANNGPHLVDMARFLLGDARARAVDARCDCSTLRVERGVPAERSSAMNVLFDHAVPVTCSLKTGCRGDVLFRLRVVLEGGWIEVTPAGLCRDGDPRPRLPRGHDGFHAAMFQAFVAWAVGGAREFAAAAESVVPSHEIVLAAFESARLGRSITLPLENRGDVLGGIFDDSSWRGDRHCFGSGDTPALGGPSSGPCSASVQRAPLPGNDRCCASEGESNIRRGFPPPGRLAADGGKPSLPRRLPSTPYIGLQEWVNVGRVLASRQMNAVDGRFVPALERTFAAMHGSCAAVASSSGTAAIHVALGAMGLSPGEEIITTPITDMGTIIPILAMGGIPVFADVDPRTGLLTADAIESKLSERTRGVIVVHLLGRPAELAPIVELCRRRALTLIEDCAQAHRATYRGRPVGTFGTFGCFSLQQSKQVTCGDGGLTLVNAPEFAQTASLFVDKGWNRGGTSRDYPILGMNYRMTELQAAVAIAQLRRVDHLTSAAEETARCLHGALRSAAGIELPPLDEDRRCAWWKFHWLVDETKLALSAREFAGLLTLEGVPAQHGYLPRPLFETGILRAPQRWPGAAALRNFPPMARREDFSGTVEFLKRAVVIPWHGLLRPRHAREIASAILKVAEAGHCSRTSIQDLPEAAVAPRASR